MKTKLILLKIVILVLVGCASKKFILEKKDENRTQIEKITINIEDRDKKSEEKAEKEEDVKEENLELTGIYKDNESVLNFVNYMVESHDFKHDDLIYTFSSVEFQQKALDRVLGIKKKKVSVSKKKKRKGKKVIWGSWDRYEKNFISNKRINMGVDYWNQHKKYLDKAYEVYGVPPEYILGILGVETIFGNYLGEYPVFYTLATLTFEENRRQNFFKNELENFLVMVRDENLTMDQIMGSYTGAIGLCQFMPSNYKHFAVDFNEDGVIDLWNPEDAIGSIANYFSKHGWKRDLAVTVRAKYKGKRFKKFKVGYKKTYSRKWLKKRHKIKPRENFNLKRVRLIKLKKGKYDEIWMASKNFYVITRYNHSAYYAMVVHQLANKIKDKYLEKKEE